MKYYYLLCLLLSLLSLFIVDARYKLVFFYMPKRASKTIITAVLFFLAWDIAGIQLGIFFPGDSKYTVSINVLPGVPVEELFFLTLLSYLTLLLWSGYVHLCASK